MTVDSPVPGFNELGLSEPILQALAAVGYEAPSPIQAQTIPNAALDVDDLNQAGCATGVGQTYGIEGTATGSSLCANSVWEIVAVATDLITEAEVVVTQGAAVRVSTFSTFTSE